MKRDYNSTIDGYPNDNRPYRYNGDYGPSHPGPYQNHNSNKAIQLMNFQHYIQTLSNNVDEKTACEQYKEFMAERSQVKVDRFFDANKDREWFRLRYHPVESQQSLQRLHHNFMKRHKIFTDLDERNFFDQLPLHYKNASAITDLLDAIIIQLEDGPKELIDQLLSLGRVPTNTQLREKYVPAKSTSVVIDDIPIDTTLSEVQDICTSANPDLIKIAQLDPFYIERGHLRRKFIAIYSSDVDIRHVCWKISRMKLNGRQISVTVNKGLSTRVIPIDPISNRIPCIINDIRSAIKLILNFDEFRGLYGTRKELIENMNSAKSEVKPVVKMEIDPSHDSQSNNLSNVVPPSPPGSEKSGNDEDEEKPFDINTLDEEKEKEKRKLYEFRFNVDLSIHELVQRLSGSQNPILEGAYNYLLDFVECTQSRYQLSQIPTDLLDETTKQELKLDPNDKLLNLQMVVKNLPFSNEESTKYLDRLLWYLRIVHSFDFYKKSFYRHEDELTYRLGVIHVRNDIDNAEVTDLDDSNIRSYLEKSTRDLLEFVRIQSQKYVSKDEERYYYRSYGKVLTDELTSYTQRIQKPKSSETEEVYKCKHCTRVFQKLSDIGRHFVSKHRWAVDTIELETDFFNAYLFDAHKIEPCPPKELLEVRPNRYAKMSNLGQIGEDPDPLLQTIEAYNKLESFVREPAPRAIVENDPRNSALVDYADVSFDEAI